MRPPRRCPARQAPRGASRRAPRRRARRGPGGRRTAPPGAGPATASTARAPPTSPAAKRIMTAAPRSAPGCAPGPPGRPGPNAGNWQGAALLMGVQKVVQGRGEGAGEPAGSQRAAVGTDEEPPASGDDLVLPRHLVDRGHGPVQDRGPALLEGQDHVDVVPGQVQAAAEDPHRTEVQHEARAGRVRGRPGPGHLVGRVLPEQKEDHVQQMRSVGLQPAGVVHLDHAQRPQGPVAHQLPQGPVGGDVASLVVHRHRGPGRFGPGEQRPGLLHRRRRGLLQPEHGYARVQAGQGVLEMPVRGEQMLTMSGRRVASISGRSAKASAPQAAAKSRRSEASGEQPPSRRVRPLAA
jgi:hypothetical protein